jgi:Uma2 family endonuclease
MAGVRTPPAQRLLLDGVDWRSYERWLRLLDERPGLRVTYDRGTLEIMILTYGHEGWGRLLGRMVVVLTEELGLPIAGGGSTTFRRRAKRRGLEPDECFWIAHEAQVRGKERIDLRTDPPPDLAIEVEVTRSALNRLAIYAALRIPEVWRFRDRGLAFHILGNDGQYSESKHSLAFPLVAAADLHAFLALRGQADENTIIRQFRAWVRQRHGTGGVAAPTP